MNTLFTTYRSARAILIVLFLWTGQHNYTQTNPFTCDGHFYSYLYANGASSGRMYQIQANPTTGNVSFNQLANQGQGLTNPIGYRSTDNFVYGMAPNTFQLYRVNSLGQTTLLGTAALNGSKIYYAGDVTPDGRYLVATGKPLSNRVDNEIVLIDLTSPTYAVTTRTLSTSGPGSIAVADIAFHPLTGVLYGYCHLNQRIVTIDPQTGQVDNQTYPAGQAADALGALFFDAFGELYGYGRAMSGQPQDRLFKLDLTNGSASLIGTGPGAGSNDGCSCPYRLEMQKAVSDTVASTCDTITYTVRIINNSGATRSGVRFIDSLHAGMNILAVTRNPFGGMVSGIGTNRLEIDNINIPLGLDSLAFEVVVTATAPTGIVKTQARLDGLPAALGDAVLSDDPRTIMPGDSTAMTLSPGCLTSLPCDGTFYISAGPTLTAARMHSVSYVNNNFSLNPLPQSIAHDINGIGYRVTDQLIYGIRVATNDAYHIDATGAATFFASLNNRIDPTLQYVSGDISPNGQYWYLLGSFNSAVNPSQAQRKLYAIDLTNPTFPSTLVNLTTPTGAASNAFCADVAVSPISGLMYGFDKNAGKLVQIDPATGIVDGSMYPTLGANTPGAVGALFFDTFGELYGYGSQPGTTLQRDYMYFNIRTGQIQYLGTGIALNRNDGCSCPYTIGMQKLVSDSVATTCDTVAYTVRITNNSGVARSGLRFLDSLHAGMNVLAVTRNPFGGTTSGIGTNRLEISNMNIPLGLDSLVFDVELTASAPTGIVKNQARLDGLPVALGDAVLSDDPGTLPPGDSTSMRINTGCGTPFVCDGDFYLSLYSRGLPPTNFHQVQYNPASGNITFRNFNNAQNQVINSIGYRSTDNFIYGLNPYIFDLFKIDSTGQASVLYRINGLVSGLSYTAGDVTPDGRSLVVSGGTANGGNTQIATIDLTSPTYTQSSATMSLSSGSAAIFSIADMAFDPFTGVLYSYDFRARRLVTIDPASGVVNDQLFPANQPPGILGAFFFDSFGNLFAYGNNSGTANPQNTLYSVNINTGQISSLATGPAATGNDGCSCPYTIEMQQEIDSLQVAVCDTFELTIRIVNNSGVARSGLDLDESFPAGLQVLNVLQNPFGGAINALPSQNLSIQNMTVPLGLDSIVLEVLVNSGTPVGSYNLQAMLTGLPVSLGDTTVSDWPRSSPRPDPTVVQVTNAPPIDLPNAIFDFCTGDSVRIDRAITGGISYQWMDNVQGAVRTISQGGRYTLQIDNGCAILMDTIDVILRPLPVLTTSPDTSICTGDTIQLQVSGANTYSWQASPFLLGNSSANPFVFPGADFTAFVTGTDQFGCSNMDSIHVQVLALPVTDAGLDTVICPGENYTLGSIALPGHQYRWNTSNNLNDSTLSQPVFSSNIPGQYLFTLEQTSPEGCVNRDAVLIDVNDIQISLQVLPNQCYQDSGGQAFVTVTGGGNPFQYRWLDATGNTLALNNRPGASDSLSGLGVGAYRVEVENSYGCLADTTFNITGPASPLLLNLDNQNNVDCFGNLSGSIEVSASGGTSPWQFSFDGGAFGNDTLWTGLGARPYTVVLRDSNDCRDTLSVTIKSPTGLFGVIVSKRDLRCFGDESGEISLQGQGGSPLYEYSTDGIVFQPFSNLTNLAAGTYSTWIRDANGCVVQVPVTLRQPDSLELSILNQNNILCNGDSSGSLSLQATGGVGSYSYSRSPDPFQTSNQFNNLPAGNHIFQVQDDSLCTVQLQTNISEPTALQLNVVQQQFIDCYNDSTAEVLLQARGGVAPYGFGLDSLSFSSDSVFSGLPAGDYTAWIEDSNGCLFSTVFSISQPDSLQLLLLDSASVRCAGEGNGFIEVDALGGSPDYTFFINGQSNGPSGEFSSLPSGSYRIRLEDANGCAAEQTIVLIEPDSLSLIPVDIVMVNCHGENSGMITVSGSGGTRPFEYKFGAQNFSEDSILQGAYAGDYTILLRDANGCMDSLFVSITEPDPIQLSTQDDELLCYGDTTGVVSVDIEGGVPTYTILWKNTDPVQSSTEATNLRAGRYKVIVTDENGCIDSAIARVSQPPLLELELVNTVGAFCDWPNGSATVSSTGGVMPHFISWYGPDTLFGPFGVRDVFGGDYWVYVEDENGCTDSLFISIPNEPAPIASFESNPPFTDSILLSDAELQFLNRSQYANSYLWDFGENGAGSSEENPGWTYGSEGWYRVQLIAYDDRFLCPDTAWNMVYIINDGKIFTGNAFTPNDDGINDFFTVKGIGIHGFEMIIFSRWGKEIRRLNSLSPGWDGRDQQGRNVPEGVYVFLIKARFADGRTQDITGTVTVIR